MACVFWKDECETTTKEFMKKIKYWRCYEDDHEEIENKDACKGGDSFHVISTPIKKFKDQ